MKYPARISRITVGIFSNLNKEESIGTIQAIATITNSGANGMSNDILKGIGFRIKSIKIVLFNYQKISQSILDHISQFTFNLKQIFDITQFIEFHPGCHLSKNMNILDGGLMEKIEFF